MRNSHPVFTCIIPLEDGAVNKLKSTIGELGRDFALRFHNARVFFFVYPRFASTVSSLHTHDKRLKPANSLRAASETPKGFTISNPSTRG
jgi:hypothetical protein